MLAHCSLVPFHVHCAWSTRIEREGAQSELQLCFSVCILLIFSLMSQASSHNGYKWHAQIVADDFFNRKICTEPGNLKPCRAVPHIKLSQLLKSLATSLQRVAKSIQIRWWRYENLPSLLISLRWWGTKRARWLDPVRTVLAPWFDDVAFKCGFVCKHQRGYVQCMWLFCISKYIEAS